MAVRQIQYASFPAARSGGASFPRAALAGTRLFARDFAVVLGVIGVYFLLRGAAPDRLSFSVEVTKQLVAAEDGRKPLSDHRISDILAQQGIQVARRTVAKYREAMNIQPANLRKSI